jgi:site-specific DNA-methyltransferase (cytosine-N4-specific)
MNAPLLCRMKPYIQPFERTLALAELRALAHASPIPVDGKVEQTVRFLVSSPTEAATLAHRLAYWEIIEGDRTYLTTQVLRERTATVVRNGVPTQEIPQLLLLNEMALPNRRCLRYGTHGIHEYRGKFFPQLVRSLLNIAGIPKRGIVADPMCGSGTTNVETVLGENQALGLDMNPLSVLMARVKCSLLSVDPELLASAYEQIRSQLMRPTNKRNGRLTYFDSLPQGDQGYLRGWFSEQVLQDLDEVARAIRLSDVRIRDFFRLCLSNIIRSVSWQKDDDLRVRKEVRLDAEIDPIREFLEELGRSVRIVLAFLHHNQGIRFGSFDVTEGDARDMALLWNQWKGRIDAIITSPPYATALPYLDTDRLSLCYLGLLSRPEHRRRDQHMIGNREISEKQRSIYWELFNNNKGKLPKSVSAMIQKVSTLNSGIEVGFRRRNLPSLLTKYFVDMERIFEGVKFILRPGNPAYVVIGNNHTIAGGERVEIKTADLLVDIAAVVGLKLEQRIPMEMLVSRDIFKKNAVASEEILCFTTPA